MQPPPDIVDDSIMTSTINVVNDQSVNLKIGEEVVAGVARHVDDVLVLHGFLVNLACLAHHHRSVDVHWVRRVLIQTDPNKQSFCSIGTGKDKQLPEVFTAVLENPEPLVHF